MKILLQHRQTKLFWAQTGWIGHEEDAISFDSALAALRFSQDQCLGDTEAIFLLSAKVPLLYPPTMSTGEELQA